MILIYSCCFLLVHSIGGARFRGPFILTVDILLNSSCIPDLTSRAWRSSGRNQCKKKATIIEFYICYERDEKGHEENVFGGGCRGEDVVKTEAWLTNTVWAN